MMPIPLFAMISSPNIPSMIEPVASTITNNTVRIALMRVKDVAANDVLDRAGRPVRYIVGLSRRDPCCNLIGGQTAGDVDVVRQSLRGYRHCCLF